MRNLPFVLWMIGYLLVVSVRDYLSYLQGDRFSSTVEGIAALFILVIWVYVGTLLYEKRH